MSQLQVEVEFAPGNAPNDWTAVAQQHWLDSGEGTVRCGIPGAEQVKQQEKMVNHNDTVLERLL